MSVMNNYTCTQCGQTFFGDKGVVPSCACETGTYYCKYCNKHWWPQTGPVIVSCTVFHAGNCCHYGEKEARVPSGMRLPPVARNSDPETSHQEPTKEKRLTQMDRVLQAIKAMPGLTAGEIGDVTKINGAWKRVSDLKNQGKIRPGAKSAIYKGKKQQTWYAILEQAQLPLGGDKR